MQYTPYEVLLKLKAQAPENFEEENEESENEENEKNVKKTKKEEKKAKKSKSKPLERSARIPISTHKVIFESKRVNLIFFFLFYHQ